VDELTGERPVIGMLQMHLIRESVNFLYRLSSIAKCILGLPPLLEIVSNMHSALHDVILRLPYGVRDSLTNPKINEPE
jgi:hypothetical protein